MKFVSVIGGASAQSSFLDAARLLGVELAAGGYAVVCGGMGGVMAAVCEGAASRGGVTVGILQGDRPQDANPFVGIPIPTGIGSARNRAVVLSGFVVCAIDGGYFVNLTDLADPDIKDFVAEYKAEFGEDPVLPNPVMAQDALIMIVEALKKAGSTDGNKLAEALANLKDIKVTSGVLTIDPANHNPLDKPAVIQQVDVTNKTFKFVKKYVSVE